MWIGKLETLNECPELNESTKAKILDFINRNDLKGLAPGRHELGGDDYVNVFEYETHQNAGVFEAHEIYADIHYAITGSEKVLYADKYSAETKPYDKDGDYSLGNVETFGEIDSDDGAVLFLPQEIHQAGVAIGEIAKVKKAVFKIKV